MPRSVTLWAPVVVSFFVQVPAALVVARVTGATLQHSLLLVLLALAGPVLLIGARRFPGPVVTLIALIAALDLFVGQNIGPPYVALAFAIIGAIVRGARVWAWVAVGGCWVAAITVAAIAGTDTWAPGRIAATTLGILIVFGIGEGFRTRRERGREFRRRLSERRESAVQAERVRIARELHDVLAHSLSQINVQAGVGLHLMPTQPDKAADALANIKETSKSALDEVRAVLGVLRSDPTEPAAPLVPEPDLDRVAALVEIAANSEAQVTLDDRLVHAEVPAPVQHALSRIVQEALTNVGRHAPRATRVSVELSRTATGFRAEVRDNGTDAEPSGTGTGTGTGTGAGAGTGDGEGRGILGMRERAELLGGSLRAGRAADGGFVVTADIPEMRIPGARR